MAFHYFCGMARFTPRIIPNIQITGIAEDTYAVGRTPEGIVCFVEGAVPGDVVDVLVFNKKKGYFQGSMQRLITPSPDRIAPPCIHFGICGGCKWQHLAYHRQLSEKENRVYQAIQRLGKVEPEERLPIMGCEQTYFYRNKLEFTFSNKRWLTREEMNLQEMPRKEPGLGFHRPGAFDQIVDIDECLLQADPSNELRNFIREFTKAREWAYFNVRSREGWLRNLIVRTTSIGEVMIVLSVHYEQPEWIEELLSVLDHRFPQLTTICYVINPKANDTISDLDYTVWKGPGYIVEVLGGIKYKIGPKSFFQTNTPQTLRLYEAAVRFADIRPHHIIYDFYTGLGSIALFVARQCKKVIGVENVEAAIEDAKENARWNNITNAEFIAGDMKDVFNQEFTSTHGRADVIITDPPRAGMHGDVIESLLELAAPRIVYISCNPATQARDINLLSVKYKLDKIQPVDMFPHTNHVESIALLTLISSV